MYVCRARAVMAAKGPEQELPAPVEFQPAAIRGEMREYQLEALKWMVNHYDNGVNCILAGELMHCNMSWAI